MQSLVLDASQQIVIPGTRFGVEMEMVIHWDQNQKGLVFSYDALAKEISELSGINVEYVRRNRHATKKYWKVVNDTSVKGGNGFELVSPVLLGREGLESINIIYDAAKKLGAEVNSTCGFHVHIDAEKMNLSERSSICHHFVALENAFDLLIPNMDRRGNGNSYCQSNSYHLHHHSSSANPQSNKQRQKLFQEVRTMEELVSLVNPSSIQGVYNRYRKLNLTNLLKKDRPCTIEFRQHGGVTSFDDAEAWICLLLLFCQNSRHREMRILPEDSSVVMESKTLFELLDCPSLHRFYEKRLTPALMKTPVWICLHCSKTFKKSSALSQHEKSLGHFECPLCRVPFKHKVDKEQHMRDKHHNRPFC